MRILIPCSGYGRIFRGIEIWAENISREFVKKGFDVYLICGQNLTPRKKIKVNLLKFPIIKRESLIYGRRPFEEISSLIESASLSISSFPFLMNFNFDVIISCQWSDIYSIFLLKKIKKFKSIFCFQSRPRELTKPLYYPLLFGSSDKIVSISNFVKKEVKKTVGLDSEVIYNGVNTKLFYPSKIKEKEKIFFLYVGGLLKKKGVYTLLAAMRNLNPERFELWIIGSGPEERKIKTLISSEKITNVKLLGKKEHKKLPKIYRASDIVVIPSEYSEAFAIVIAEAMACGRPIIASNVGGLSEVVKKSNSGLLFEPGNERDLTEKMLDLAENIKKRKILGKNGGGFAEKELDWSKIAEKYIKLIES
ncbi:MAG: glycosyltransferase family 4 protein [Candidatus Aenigmarchaeota archaeon]|nr:glycosyltransferase family 4 protein [Candidatus Aenigmarchaeota archaeon]